MCKSIIIAIVITVAIVIIATTVWSAEPFLPIGGSPYSVGWRNNYATLGSYGYDQPLFEPDVLRRCADGRFMFTSNPQLQDFCKNVPAPMLDRVACAIGFNGQPIRMRYTAPAYGCVEDSSCGKMRNCECAFPS